MSLFVLLLGLSLLLGACANAGFGSDSFLNTFTGVVIDGGVGQENIDVVLTKDGIDYDDNTDVEGKFSISGLSEGEYSVTVGGTPKDNITIVKGTVWYEVTYEISID